MFSHDSFLTSPHRSSSCSPFFFSSLPGFFLEEADEGLLFPPSSPHVSPEELDRLSIRKVSSSKSGCPNVSELFPKLLLSAVSSSSVNPRSSSPWRVLLTRGISMRLPPVLPGICIVLGLMSTLLVRETKDGIGESGPPIGCEPRAGG